MKGLWACNCAKPVYFGDDKLYNCTLVWNDLTYALHCVSPKESHLEEVLGLSWLSDVTFAYPAIRFYVVYPWLGHLTTVLHFWRYRLKAPWSSTSIPEASPSSPATHYSFFVFSFPIADRVKPNAQQNTSEAACLQAAPAHVWPEELVWFSRAWKKQAGQTSGGSAVHPDAPLQQLWMKIK